MENGTERLRISGTSKPVKLGNHRNGQGIAKNNKTAVKWWKRAAEQGHVTALRLVERVEEKFAKTKQQTDENTKPSPFERAKQQCASLGFKEGTEKFGDCVVKLYK